MAARITGSGGVSVPGTELAAQGPLQSQAPFKAKPPSKPSPLQSQAPFKAKPPSKPSPLQSASQWCPAKVENLSGHVSFFLFQAISSSNSELTSASANPTLPHSCNRQTTSWPVSLQWSIQQLSRWRSCSNDNEDLFALVGTTHEKHVSNVAVDDVLAKADRAQWHSQHRACCAQLLNVEVILLTQAFGNKDFDKGKSQKAELQHLWQ